jgi:hypothetical protein
MRGNESRMEREGDESGADWHARVLRDLQAARAEENRHWRRLRDGQPNGRPAVLDNAYMDAVDRADQVAAEVPEAARAAERERAI